MQRIFTCLLANTRRKPIALHIYDMNVGMRGRERIEYISSVHIAMSKNILNSTTFAGCYSHQVKIIGFPTKEKSFKFCYFHWVKIIGFPAMKMGFKNSEHESSMYQCSIESFILIVHLHGAQQSKI